MLALLDTLKLSSNLLLLLLVMILLQELGRIAVRRTHQVDVFPFERMTVHLTS